MDYSGQFRFRISGLILAQPYFGGKVAVPGENRTRFGELSRWSELVWRVACPGCGDGVDDLWLNPGKDPNLSGIGCGRIQVFVSEMDYLRERDWWYAEKVRESGWSGDIEVVEYKGEQHVFHLNNLTSSNSLDLRRRIVQFIHRY